MILLTCGLLLVCKVRIFSDDGQIKIIFYFSQVWRDNGAGSWSVIATVGGHSHRVSMASLRPGTYDKMVTSSLDR